jgi:opacity protein-like surface antigen
MSLPVRPFARVIAVLAVLAALLAASAGQASAATYIEQPTTFSCGNALVSIPPVRVWATRTEQVVWGITLERWNGSGWVRYSQSSYWASFNSFGQNVTPQYAWILYGSNTGARYNNNRLNEPVRHQGYYRVISAVAAPGLGSTVYIGGGSYCWMP